MTILWVLGASVFVSLISLVGIFTLLLNEKFLNKILILLISFSAGALMGAAFLHLIPEALESAAGESVYIYILASFVLFFVLERYFLWRHCHSGACDVHAFSYLNLIGDGIHNLFDGLTIGASFVVDIRFGIITTIAIVLHEIPQEIGDFGILVYGGFSRSKALFYNYLSAIAAIVGSVVGYYSSEIFTNCAPVIISFAAGGFIYIAGCDLIPEIHKEKSVKKATLSMVFFVLGILLMFITRGMQHH